MFFCNFLIFLILLKKTSTLELAISIEDNDESVIKTVNKAISEHKIVDINVTNLKIIKANNSLTKNQIYEKLIFNNTKPILLIDTTKKNFISNSFSSKIKELVREIGLPTISTGVNSGKSFKPIEQWKSLSNEEEKIFLDFSSTNQQIEMIISDLIKNFNPSLAVLLYDDQFNLDDKYSFLFKNFKGKYLAKKINDENCEEVIKKIKIYEKGYFFVLASLDLSMKILENLSVEKLLTVQRNWYFITKNIGVLNCNNCNYGSITLIQPLKTKQLIYDHNCTISKFNSKLTKLDVYFYYDLIRFILLTISEIKKNLIKNKIDLDINNFFLNKSIKPEEKNKLIKYLDFRYIMSMESFTGHYGRFVVLPSKKHNNFPNYQELTMRLSKIEFWIDKDEKKNLIESQYSNSDDTEKKSYLKLIKYGEWIFEPYKGVFVWTAALLQNSFKKHYKIVTIVQPPFIMKRINGNQIEWYGYCLDLLYGMQKEMNNSWTFEMYEVPDGQCGIKDLVTNKWNGIIGQLADSLADIAVGPVSVMAERENVVDFTVPYYDLVGISILMKKSASRPHLFKFLTVLENQVWLYIFFAYVVTSLILWIFDLLSPYSFNNNREKYQNSLEKRDFNIKECFWFCMTSITPQGGGEAPKNLSGRMVCAVWWTFGFIIIACYTANLAAFLTVSRLDSPIESLNHLADQYRIRYAAQVGTQALTYFERMAHIEVKFYEIWKQISLEETNIVDVRERARMSVWDYPITDKYTKILKQMYISGLPKTFDEGVRRVKKSKSAQEGFAFLADATKIKYAAMINCELRQVGNEFSRKPLALAVPENSTLKDTLSSAILKLLNQRKLESLKEKWWNDNPDRKEDCDYDKKSNDGISINNIGGVFVVIFVGVILACITLFFEWIWKKIKGSKFKTTVVNIQNINQSDFNHPSIIFNTKKDPSRIVNIKNYPSNIYKRPKNLQHYN